MNINQSLNQLRAIGLTEGELKVYGALLRVGEATKTALVRESGIAPANLYDIANRLAEKGIVSIVEKNSVKHFAPADPRNLLTFLEQKKEEIAKEEAIVRGLLPMLQAAQGSGATGTRVETFTGWRGLTTVFEDLIVECAPGDACLVSGASQGAQPERADRFFLKYSKRRAEKGIRLRIIFNAGLRARKDRVGWFLKEKACDVRFLDQRTTSETTLYRDTTLILVLAQEPIAIRIRDRAVTEAFRQQFEALWRGANDGKRKL